MPKLTKEMVDMLIEQALNEDTQFSIRSQDSNQTGYENFGQFVDAVQKLQDDEQYTIVSPQTGEDGATGSGKTIKDKFKKPKDNRRDSIAPEDTGYLGDVPIKHYREDGVELPSLFVQAFENSGFTEGDYKQRIQKLNNFLLQFKAASNSQQQQLEFDTELSTQFSNIIVAEFLEKIIDYVYLGSAKKLEYGGFLFESFMALLFSGTLPVAGTSYADIIDNKLDNISVKFIAGTSSNYQAWSTVKNHFDNNKDPMIHLVAVKEKVSKIQDSKISFYLDEVTFDDYTELSVKVTAEQGTKVVQTQKAIYHPPRANYKINNDWKTATATAISPKEKTLNEWTVGNDPRITYLQYGDKIGELIIPPPKEMRAGTKQMMNTYSSSIDSLFKEVTNFRKASIQFFSAKEDQKETKAGEVAKSYKNLKTYINEGFETREVAKMNENKQKKFQDLDKMIEELMLEHLQGDTDDNN